MRKIITTVVFVLVTSLIHAQNLPVLLIDTDPESMALAKSGETVSDRILEEKSAFVKAGIGFWAPKGANNMTINADASYRIKDMLLVNVEFQNFKDRMPSYGMTESGVPTNKFTPSETSVGLGVSYRIIKDLSVGLNAKYLSVSGAKGSGDAAKASAIALGINAAYKLKKLSLGLAVENIGSKYKFDDVAYPLPLFAKVTASYEALECLDVHAEIDYVSKGGLMAGFGVEYNLKDFLFVRGGYHYGDKAIPSHAAVGLGFKFFGVSLNAAYLLASETLGNTMTFGLGYSF